jgi:hypothetical protein
MTSQDPLEILRQSRDRRTEQQLELVTVVLDNFKAMHEAERRLYQARRRYIESFKTAIRAQWKAKDLREAGLPTPKVSVLKRRMDFRYVMTPAAEADPPRSNNNAAEI